MLLTYSLIHSFIHSCCCHAIVGLVLAYCFQSVFGISFVESVDDIGAESMNVYGAVRTLFGPADDWYSKARESFSGTIKTNIIRPLQEWNISSRSNLHGSKNNKATISERVISGARPQDAAKSVDMDMNISMISSLPSSSSLTSLFVDGWDAAMISTIISRVSLFPISFHYVSQIETMMIYQLLYNSNNNHVVLAANTIPPYSYDDFIAHWPHNDRDAGHYSRWKMSDVELRVLYWYLTAYARIAI